MAYPKFVCLSIRLSVFRLNKFLFMQLKPETFFFEQEENLITNAGRNFFFSFGGVIRAGCVKQIYCVCVCVLTFPRYLFSFELIPICVYASDAFINFDFPVWFPWRRIGRFLPKTLNGKQMLPKQLLIECIQRLLLYRALIKY